MQFSDQEFEELLDLLVDRLTGLAREVPFSSSPAFELAVRQEFQELLEDHFGKAGLVDFEPHPHGFPDVAVGTHGIEVKFTTNDTWRSVANSVLETNRVDGVEQIYVVFGKQGGVPEVRWAKYADSVVHVRTSHVPRFEVDLEGAGSLFSKMETTYDDFRALDMPNKMSYIRRYARGRLKEGERLWWLEDPEEGVHSLPIQPRIYTRLDPDTKNRIRAEGALLCPRVVSHSRDPRKYDDFAFYLLTYHGVLVTNARDAFSAGSVANPRNATEGQGKGYIWKSFELLQDEMRLAALELRDELFEEYWGQVVPPEDRIAAWLKRADYWARDWVPSDRLFREKSL